MKSSQMRWPQKYDYHIEPLVFVNQQSEDEVFAYGQLSKCKTTFEFLRLAENTNRIGAVGGRKSEPASGFE
jgi:hypothetical protein